MSTQRSPEHNIPMTTRCGELLPLACARSCPVIVEAADAIPNQEEIIRRMARTACAVGCQGPKEGSQESLYLQCQVTGQWFMI